MMISLITRILMMISLDVIEEAVAAPRCDHDLWDCSPASRSFICLPINIYVEDVHFSCNHYMQQMSIFLANQYMQQISIFLAKIEMVHFFQTIYSKYPIVMKPIPGIVYMQYNGRVCFACQSIYRKSSILKPMFICHFTR